MTKQVDTTRQSRHLGGRIESRKSLPGSKTVHGAVVLCDVVGFTSHVEAMSDLGRAGVESFSFAIDSYMDRVIRVVEAHGGDILDIAGDSLLCLWEANESETEAAVEAAARAALSVQQVIAEHPLGFGRTAQTRIGIAAGRIELTTAGGVDGQWELLVQGPTLTRVQEAERRCPPGAIAVDSTVLGVLGAAAVTSPIDVALFRLEALDRPGYSKIDLSFATTRSKTSMEFRRLSIAMIRVPELSVGNLELIHRIVGVFQSIVGGYGGEASSVADNKGVRLLAVFGSPGFAHEDDPVRAVRSLQALASELSADAISMSAGVATGRALHGLIGNDIRRAVTMAGEVINVAARLSTTANNEVLCDQETTVAAQVRYSFAVMNPILVKGKTIPISVFELLGPTDVRRPRRSTVHGRSREQQRLFDLLDTGSSTCAVIVADAGLGKSAMLEHLEQSARQAGRNVVVARADAVDRTTPLLAWRDAIDDAVAQSLNRLARNASITEAVRALLPPALEGEASVLGAVLGDPDFPPAAVGDEKRAAVLPRLVAALLTAIPEHPLFLVEDAHWADSASLAVISALRALDPPVPMLISTRPDGRVRVGSFASDNWTIDLGPLDDDGLRLMMSDLLAGHDVPDQLFEFVKDRVGGNPFFCEQLLKRFMETGTVLVDGGNVKIGDLDVSYVPSAVEGVIVSRFDRLDEASKLCLKAASVIGRRQQTDLVQACVGDVNALRVLAAIGGADILRELKPTTFEFRHVIARDVIYGLMTDLQRRDLHQKVAEHLEQHDSPAGAATLGRHWVNAGRPDLAERYMAQAAQEAFAAGSFAETRALVSECAELRKAAGSPVDTDTHVQLRLRASRAAYFLGLLQEGQADLLEVIEILDDPLPTTDAEHHAEHDRFEAELAEIDAGGAGRPSRKHDAALFDAYRYLVPMQYMLGASGAPIVTSCLRGLLITARLGERVDGAEMQALLAGGYATLGNIERFDFHARQSISTAESDEGAVAANHVWRMLAVAYASIGRWTDSIDAGDRALAALDPDGRNREVGIWQTRAAVLLCDGRIAQAESAWSQTAKIAKRDGNPRLERWSRLDEVQTLIELDRVDEAEASLLEMMARLGPPTDPLGTIEQAYTLAMLRSVQGRHIEAVREARQVVAMIEAASPSGFHWMEFCSGAAEAMCNALLAGSDGLPAELSAEIDSVVDLTESYADTFPHVAPRVPFMRALSALGNGDLQAASTGFDRAIEMARQAGYHYDVSRFVVTRASLGITGEPAELVEACRVLDKLGAKRWLARAESARL